MVAIERRITATASRTDNDYMVSDYRRFFQDVGFRPSRCFTYTHSPEPPARVLPGVMRSRTALSGRRSARCSTQLWAVSRFMCPKLYTACSSAGGSGAGGARIPRAAQFPPFISPARHAARHTTIHFASTCSLAAPITATTTAPVEYQPLVTSYEYGASD